MPFCFNLFEEFLILLDEFDVVIAVFLLEKGLNNFHKISNHLIYDPFYRYFVLDVGLVIGWKYLLPEGVQKVRRRQQLLLQ